MLGSSVVQDARRYLAMLQKRRAIVITCLAVSMLLSVIYNFLEKLLGLLIGFLVVGTSVIAAIVGNWDDLASTLSGMFAFGYFPTSFS